MKELREEVFLASSWVFLNTGSRFYDSVRTEVLIFTSDIFTININDWELTELIYLLRIKHRIFQLSYVRSLWLYPISSQSS